MVLLVSQDRSLPFRCSGRMAAWRSFACLCVATVMMFSERCSAESNLCDLSVDGLHDWLLRKAPSSPSGDGSVLDWASVLRGHANALHANRVDGAALCYGPPDWIQAQMRLGANYTSSSSSYIGISGSTSRRGNVFGAMPSSTYTCKRETIDLVDRAVALWHGKGSEGSSASPKPGAALEALSTAAHADGQCCAPYREFSRFFLGANSPYVQLRSGPAKNEALQAALRVWRQPSPAAAAEVSSTAGVATPIASLTSQWRLLAGYASAHALFYGPTSDKASAAEVFHELLHASAAVDLSKVESDAASSSSASAAGTAASPAQAQRSANSRNSGSARVLFATVASEERAELGHLRASASRAGVSLHVLGLGQKYEGHETKLRLYNEWLSNSHGSSTDGIGGDVQPNDVVCLVDAYDVLLSPAAAELGERFLALEEETGKSVLFAAERTLWPDAALGALYPPSQPTLRKNEGNSGDSSSDSSSSSGVAHPLRFLNSGTVVGRAWALKYVLESVGVLGALSACGPDDQRAFHTVMLQHPQLIGLDYDGVVFQTLHFLTSPLAVESNGQVVVAVDGNGNGDDENDVDGNGRYSSKLSRVQRQEWQKRPCAVHGNGGDGKPAFARLVSGWQAALAAGDANEAAEGGSTNTVRDAQHSSRSSSKTAAAAAAVSVEPPPFSSGIAFYQAGDLNRAEVAFRKALASPLEPAQQIDSAYNLGVVLTELGKLGEAEEVYHQHALRLNPTHEGSLLNAAALRSHAGDGVGANALLDRCLRAHPDSNEARQLQAKFREGPF